MLNLSGIATVPPGGHYDLSMIGNLLDNTNNHLTSNERRFLEFLRENRQVLYDWGGANFFACVAPVTIDRKEKKFVIEGELDPDHKDNWAGVPGDRLHEILKSTFSGGEWGPSTIDEILRIMKSGIELDIFETEKFGPKNPEQFMTDLKSSLKKLQPDLS